MSGLDHNVFLTTDGLGHIHVHELAQLHYLENRYYVNIVSRFNLSFGSAVVKIYPFANLCWVNKDKTIYSPIHFPSP